jgi:hypothetical protein
MFGEPKDVNGECNARLYLGDDYGDNTCTIRCTLTLGHGGPHRETCRDGTVIILFDRDERKKCDHGCGQWNDHDDDVTCPKNAADHDLDTCRFCNDGLDPKICEHCGANYYGLRHLLCPNRPKDEEAFASTLGHDDFSEP